MANIEPAPTPTEPTVETEKTEAPAPKPAETAQLAPSAVKSETVTEPPAPVPATVPHGDATAETKTTETAAIETPAPEPTKAADPTLSTPNWGPISKPLETFYRRLPEILEFGAYNEVFGVTLHYDRESTSPNFSTLLILQKFLRANQNDVDKAADQLVGTLKWRKEFEPLKTIEMEHDRSKFEGLGYVQVNATRGWVATWNVYGAVKDFKGTFGNVTDFMKWRVGLMEAAIAKLDLANTEKSIPDFGKGTDPHQVIQIHDYLGVAFLRMDPNVRTSSKHAVEVFRDFYPEMLHTKYFLNVPVIMGWVFAAMKMIVPRATTAKFNVMSYGDKLVEELGPEIPKAYGGTELNELKDLGEPLKLSETPTGNASTSVEAAA